MEMFSQRAAAPDSSRSFFSFILLQFFSLCRMTATIHVHAWNRSQEQFVQPRTHGFSFSFQAASFTTDVVEKFT